MIKHIWSVVCKESKIDETTNNVSIDEAYENIQFDINTEDVGYSKGISIGIPFPFEIVSLFFRDNVGKTADLEETVAILDPKGNKLAEVVSRVQFKEKNDRMRNVLKFDTMALTVTGTYLFQIFMTKEGQSDKKELVSAVPINIKVNVNGEEV